MKKLFHLYFACFFAACALAACQQADDMALTGADAQPAPETRAEGIESFARHLIVEVNDVNILNAGEYTLSNGQPFFTHVVIYASNIRGDASGNVMAYNNPNNAALLADPAKYIKPLQDKGIKVLLGYLGDHTGAGFANLNDRQIESFCKQVIAVGDAAGVDGYFLDDEWAEYGTRGWSAANDTSFTKMVLWLRDHTDKIITALDWGYVYTLSPEAGACFSLVHQGALNGYNMNTQFAPSQCLPYSIDLRGPAINVLIKARISQSIKAGAGGCGFYDLRAEPTRLSTFNAVAEVFGLTCTHSGVSYPKDYGR